MSKNTYKYENKSKRPKRSFSHKKQLLWPNHVITMHNTHTTMRLFILWCVAIFTFASGIASIVSQHHSVASRQNPSVKQNNDSAHATNHAIFRVDDVIITTTQWHNAVQAAFEARASSGQYLGGTQTDNTIINTQAIHTILDPIAIQDVIKERRLTSNYDTLYQEWIAQASPQEHQFAQRYKDAASFKLQITQEQLEKDVVNKLTSLPIISEKDVYEYYKQNLSKFARTAPQMHVQQIMVTSPQAVMHIVDQINRNVPFFTIETTYDVSGPFYRSHGGDLGWITLTGSGYPAEWVANVASLKKGQIGAPFKIDDKYYIVKCLEGPDYEPWPFFQVKNQARYELNLQQVNNAFNHIILEKEQKMQIVLVDQQYRALLQQFETILR